MNDVHIYSASPQRATKYIDNCSEHTFTFENGPMTSIPTACCYRWMWAKDCVAQVFYDGTYFYCADGKGCKMEKIAYRVRPLKSQRDRK